MNVKVTTYISLFSSDNIDVTAGPTVTSLSDAHPFPNPFKPNSSLGHSIITFSQLTPGSKVQIFTIAGDPVFDKKINPSSSSLVWDAKNESGKTLASGVYYFLITDDSGNSRKGKLAIIR